MSASRASRGALRAVAAWLRRRAFLVTLLGRAARRVVWALFVVFGVGTVAFFLERELPGDPARLLLGAQASAADVARTSHIYGLDRPIGEQYALFWQRLWHRRSQPGDAAEGALVRPVLASLSIGGGDEEHATCATIAGNWHLDLGYSPLYRRPVAALIGERAVASLELALAALGLQLLLGLVAGTLAARHRGSVWDRLTIGATLLGSSAPIFVTGLGLQYLFAYELGWLPYDAAAAGPGDRMSALVLPALTLGVFGAALYARIARDELTTALGSDYARAARARGAGSLRVLLVHALRNAILPIATLVVLELGTLVGGAVVTETLFRWPGLGKLAVDALVNRDGALTFGTVLFGAGAMVVATLLLDLVYVLVDPRLRRGGRD